MLHDHFRQLPDRRLAETLSEMMRPGAYTFVYTFTNSPPAPLLIGVGSPPPAESQLATMTAAFFKGGIKRYAVHGLLGGTHDPGDTTLIRTYTDDVGRLQGRARNLERFAHLLGFETADEQVGRLGRWAVNAAAAAGNRLIAAHAIFVTAEGEELYHSLAYPTAMRALFPAVIRSGLEAAAEAAHAHPERPGLPQTVRDSLISALHDEHDRELVTALPAAAVLPSQADFEASLRAYRQQHA